MKRFLQFLILSCLLLLSVQIGLAQGGTLGTTTSDVWLRVGPGTDWRKLEIIPAGTTVAIDGRDSTANWVHVITSGGQVGWLYAYYVNTGSVGIVSLPYIAAYNAPITVSAPQQGTGPGAGQANAGGAQGVLAQVTANVNVRSGPSTNYRRVGSAFAGSSFTIDGRDGLLEWVRGITQDGVIGWISAEFIALTYDQIAALPVVTVNTPFTLQPGAGSAPTSNTPAEATAPEAVNIQPLASNAPVTGFSYGGHVADFSDFAANWMRAAGMTWAKRQVHYNRGDAPENFAGIINDAHARGFRILLGVVGNPNDIYSPGYFEDFARFVGGLAALGADAIEVWNEPNLDREWPTWRINPGDYVQMLAQAYNAIKSSNPNTLVISAAPAPTGAEAAFPGQVMNDNNFVAGMVAAGGLNYLDCVGAHYNEGVVSPDQTSGDPRGEYYTRYFWGMVNTYTSITGGAKPICFTELGYLSPEGYGPLSPGFAWGANTSVAEQAAWLDRAIALSASSGRVLLVIIWNVDFTIYGDDPQAGYAIIRPGGDCPACRALGS